jgi:hypothetical protein
VRPQPSLPSPLQAKPKSGVNVHCAPQMCGGARNAMQAISPVVLGDELNTGWHLNVPHVVCS